LITTECQICGLQVCIIGKFEDFKLLDSPQWATGFPCIKPSCSGTAIKIPMALAKNPLEMPIGSYFKALYGLGFGKMIGAEPELVQSLFCNKKISSVDLFPIGQPTRSLIRSLTFEDGTILHFASSNEGACIYLVEVGNADNCMASDRDSEGSSSNRAQDGHPSSVPQELGEAIYSSDELQNDRSNIRKASEVSERKTFRLRYGSAGSGT
jgi:hypothetical protein